ncbi:MAG: hypothetical protein U9P44_04300, partial [archaeon]|nr:hypothetical protein [archaeon]
MDDIHDLEELKIPQLDAENIIRIYAVREFLSGERQRVIEATRDGVKELIADNYSRFEEEIKVKHGLFGLRKIKLRYVEFFGKRDDSFNTFLCDEGSEIFDALLPDDVKEICGQVELYANISSVLRKVESLNKILCPKECSDKCSDCLPERQLKTTPETVEYYIAELAKEVVAYNENIGNISQIF